MVEEELEEAAKLDERPKVDEANGDGAGSLVLATTAAAPDVDGVRPVAIFEAERCRCG
jgi:hypothetical protein